MNNETITALITAATTIALALIARRSEKKKIHANHKKEIDEINKEI